METETFTDTFVDLQHRLHLAATGILRDADDADDAVQDAFCNLWNSPRRPKSRDEARFKLFATLRNICLNKLKRKKGAPEDLSVFSSPDTRRFDEEDFGRVRKFLMSGLPPLQREIFELSVFSEMEYEEIAFRLGISVEAVRMNMSRARKRAREQYRKYADGKL